MRLIATLSRAPSIAGRAHERGVNGGIGDAGDLVSKALRRIRVLVAILVLTPLAGQGLARGRSTEGWSVVVTAALVLGVVLVVNLISTASGRVGRPKIAALLGAAELVADTILVVAMVTLLPTFNPEVIWAILVVPVLEGALRYRLRGAFLTWLAVAAGYLTFVWHGSLAGGGATISGASLADLEIYIQRLGVILLAAIPTGYLSEQLLMAITAQRRARELATRRGEMLEAVVRTAEQISRIEGDVLDSVTVGLRHLGFTASDLCVREGSAWRALSQWSADENSSLPSPELPAGGIEAAQSYGGMVVVEREHADRLELDGLVAGCLETVVVAPLDGVEGFALRAGLPEGSKLAPDQADCIALLARLVGVALRNGTLVNDLRGMHEQLEHQAFHDQLTGLANRARFMSALEDVLEGDRAAVQVAVLFLDLDRFKPVNDLLGHDVGDGLLIETAQRLTKCVRDRDLVARLGGDEFTVLVRDYEGDAPRAIAERIRTALARPFDVAGHTVDIGASVGIARATSADAVDPAELLRRADAAMYQEKQQRRTVQQSALQS